jgi:SPP1 gp7 family putative phage head morphogenesis protein
MSLPPGLAALFNLRPDRAADFLKAKGLKLTGPYWELDGPAHSRVFTVANLAKLDVLADIKAAVQEAIDTGKTERWFRGRLEDELRRSGWWGPVVSTDPDTGEARMIQAGSYRRLQTIYRTNLQNAYMAGRHAQALEQADRAPFAQYLAVRDSRTRPAHAALHGKVFRLDSPEWSVISPPNGYNCRCRARYLSQRELDRRGLTPETDVRLLERTSTAAGSPDRAIERGVSVPSLTRPGERDVLWADRGWDHLPGSDGAERALVDRVLARAAEVGGVLEVVLQELRRNGVDVAVPEVETNADDHSEPVG